jgi:hypothetical protein
MKRLFCRTLLVAASSLLLVATCRQTEVADWTVLVYLNGDNDLVNKANLDFVEMARVGSTQRVNIVVQFDRQGRNGEWEQTLRFRVLRNMPHEPPYAYQDLGEVDMADGHSVEQFITSSMNAFPAKHYAFVLWGHGLGERLLTVNGMEVRLQRRSATPPFCTGGATTPASVVSYKGGTTDGSDDETKQKNILYMRELADSLRRVLHGRQFDVFIFDECLMGMAENAYALRDTVHYMVASEEMVPPDGLDYSDWLAALVANPGMSPSALATTVVDSYERAYPRQFDCLTMSAFDLRAAKRLGSAVSRLADVLRANIHSESAAITRARDGVAIYGNPDCREGDICFYHVDLQRFCEILAKNTAKRDIRDAANAVVDLLGDARVRAVAGRTTRATKGSNGLAIYFPPTGSAYCRDGANECGYERKNEYFPLEFVQQTHWSDFLHEYFKIRPGASLPKCESAENHCTDPFANRPTTPPGR